MNKKTDSKADCSNVEQSVFLTLINHVYCIGNEVKATKFKPFPIGGGMNEFADL